MRVSRDAFRSNVWRMVKKIEDTGHNCRNAEADPKRPPEHEFALAAHGAGAHAGQQIVALSFLSHFLRQTPA